MLRRRSHTIHAHTHRIHVRIDANFIPGLTRRHCHVHIRSLGPIQIMVVLSVGRLLWRDVRWDGIWFFNELFVTSEKGVLHVLLLRHVKNDTGHRTTEIMDIVGKRFELATREFGHEYLGLNGRRQGRYT